MPIARQLIRQLLAAALPRRRFLLRGPSEAAERPRIALTFDDGPHDEHTPALLDRLAELGIRGTFFVVGSRAARCPR
ncbi:MAG: polysaccharide deacetylase family protein, partial [Vicinamibacterales bacterium]